MFPCARPERAKLEPSACIRKRGEGSGRRQASSCWTSEGHTNSGFLQENSFLVIMIAEMCVPPERQQPQASPARPIGYEMIFLTRVIFFEPKHFQWILTTWNIWKLAITSGSTWTKLFPPMIQIFNGNIWSFIIYLLFCFLQNKSKFSYVYTTSMIIADPVSELGLPPNLPGTTGLLLCSPGKPRKTV
jgi:hypothetical protein